MIVHPADTPTDAKHEIRTDLWSTMSTQDLIMQREMLTTRISQVHSMLGPSSGLHWFTLYERLTAALNSLNDVIDKKDKGSNNR